MFAFALLDDDRFLLARDPVGIKPLYYGYIDGNLYFTSELAAIAAEHCTVVLTGEGADEILWRYKVQYTQGAGT